MQAIPLKLLALMSFVVLAACSVPDDTAGRALAPAPATEADALMPQDAQNVAALRDAFLALGPNVDPAEAERAAQVTYAQVAHLRKAYDITDPPLVHNMKVNAGLKPRGLCWHWAVDMGDRLAAERFETLDVHQAIANYDNLRLEHSTAILSARGAPMEAGIILDPWRAGGTLTWMPVLSDTRYNWTPRAEVFALKRARTQGSIN